MVSALRSISSVSTWISRPIPSDRASVIAEETRIAISAPVLCGSVAKRTTLSPTTTTTVVQMAARRESSAQVWGNSANETK